MVILAIDTSTRTGSIALARDERLLETIVGDPTRTHGERLPGDILALLGRQSLRLGDIDLYAVAIGPGSFTGLRVGLATVQGLALVHARRIVPVSTLEGAAVAFALAGGADVDPLIVRVCLDAGRGELFTAVYSVRGAARDAEGIRPRMIEPPSVQTVPDVLNRLAADAGGTQVVGDRPPLPSAATSSPEGWGSTLPPLAPALAHLAAWRRVSAVRPHALVPEYVRRPDAELARERRPG